LRSPRNRDRADKRSQCLSATSAPITLIIDPGIHSSSPPIC
jgi:hypothetical protein